MRINLNDLPYKYWDDKIVISYLQRRIIVYSIIYYYLNDSIISDKDYDRISHELVEAQSSVSKDELKQTDYYYVMYDFDGSTGFDLYDRLNEYDKKYLMNMADHILKRKNTGK
jgi:hypothetical protein